MNLVERLLGRELELRDLVRFNRMDDGPVHPESYLLSLKFFGGAGYALWTRNRNVSINGFDLFFGRKVKRYTDKNLVEKRDVVAGITCTGGRDRKGNGNWMPQW